MAAKRKAAPAPQVETGDDPVPQNIDDIRDALARRIHQLISTEEQLWRTCREPCCKRARACRAPKIGCSNERPRKPATAEQVARVKAEFYRALQAEVARRDAEREQRQEK